jgi:hypothetical protein
MTGTYQLDETQELFLWVCVRETAIIIIKCKHVLENLGGVTAMRYHLGSKG